MRQVDALRRAQTRCSLRIISINDVYELDNLPFFDGVIRSSAGSPCSLQLKALRPLVSILHQGRTTRVQKIE
jgi:hypothetical protein